MCEYTTLDDGSSDLLLLVHVLLLIPLVLDAILRTELVGGAQTVGGRRGGSLRRIGRAGQGVLLFTPTTINGALTRLVYSSHPMKKHVFPSQSRLTLSAKLRPRKRVVRGNRRPWRWATSGTGWTSGWLARCTRVTDRRALPRALRDFSVF